MSGHSKWATTKRQKAGVDARRAKVFTKISNNISVAARRGADPTMNPKLRMAIDQAKEVRMPKENIERAIARGAGTGGAGVQLEEITYEGFGPGGVGIIVEVVTDNKNRTAANMKHLFTSHGGNIGGSGSVAWQFEHRGVLYAPALTDEQELAAIEAGAVDIRKEADQTVVVSAIDDLEAVRAALQQQGVGEIQAALEWLPKELVKSADAGAITALLEALDDGDDVANVYTNADV